MVAIFRNPRCELSIFCVSPTAKSGTSKMHLSPLVALAAVCSKAVVLLLLIRFSLLLFLPYCNCSMFCCALLCVHSSFAIILVGTSELVALLCLSSWCLVIVVWLFLTVPRLCLQFVIVVFPDHAHLLFLNACYTCMVEKFSEYIL